MMATSGNPFLRMINHDKEVHYAARQLCLLPPEFILSLVEINGEINLLLAVRLTQFPAFVYSKQNFHFLSSLLLFSPLLVLYVILDVSVSDNHGGISVGINKQSLSQ